VDAPRAMPVAVPRRMAAPDSASARARHRQDCHCQDRRRRGVTGIAVTGVAVTGIAIAGIAIAGIAADGRLLLAAAVTTAASLQGGGADRADQENAQHAQCRGKETNSHGNLQAPFGMPGVKSGHAFPASRERLIFTGMKKGALRRLVSSLISTGSVPA